MDLEELKLPDHIFLRRNGTVTIVERGTGDERSFQLPTTARVVKRMSAVRYLGALASAIFAVYFASMFMDVLFTTNLEIVLIPVIIAVPFVFDRFGGGRAAVLAYLGAFIAFALIRGGFAAGSLRLGVIFFGGGPVDYQGYSIVPASDLLTSLILGLLPYVFMKMLGQAILKYRIVIGSGGDEYAVWVRHPTLAGEVLAFLKRADPAGFPKGENTSI